MFTFNENLISDLYKDAYGSRSASAMWPVNGTDAEKQAEWDRVCDIVELEIEAQKLRQDYAKHDFEESIAKCLSVGAKNRKQAIEWALHSHCDDMTCKYSVDIALHSLGLGMMDSDNYVKEMGF